MFIMLDVFVHALGSCCYSVDRTNKRAPVSAVSGTHHILLPKAHLPFRGSWPRASPRATKPGRGSTRTVNSL